VPLDPTIQGLLTLLGQMRQHRMADGTPEQARAGFRAITVGIRTPAALVPVGGTEDTTIPGDVAPLPARIYRPQVDGPVPTVVFFHGGGFVIGDLDTHDNQCRWLCREVGAVVVSVGYRLAPEARFPAALHDSIAATRWVAERAASLGGDPDRLAVAGDSAGGNLAAVVAQVCRDDRWPRLAAQLLVCPVTDLATDGEYPSRVENADGYLLTAADLRWFRGHYMGPEDDACSPRLSPLRGELGGLPPAVVVTAEFDPLRDEGEAYAQALAAAGVPVVLHRFDGLVHGFVDLPALSPACVAAIRTLCASFRMLLTAA
jgi:acetyl esterase